MYQHLPILKLSRSISMNIYTTIDRTPYTYFIRWNDLDINYYGRRTAKGCHPEEFFISYFTSSKYVEDVIAEYGMPDIIKIHKIFADIDSCKTQEEKFLKRFNAAKDLRWLNVTNGDKNWDRTNLITAKDVYGNTFTVENTDLRYISGELRGINSGVSPSYETRLKQSLKMKGCFRKPMSEYTKMLISNSRKLMKKPRYIVSYQGGEEITIFGLQDFAKENNLHISGLSKVVVGKMKSTKGWTCRKIENEGTEVPSNNLL